MKHFLRSSCLALCVLLAAPASEAQMNFQAELVTFGGGRPVTVTSPPGDGNRLFVVDKTGRIRIIKNGSLLGTPFLDWVSNLDATGEGGLLGLAFHPDYASNGRFFISYTAPLPGGWSVVSELAVNPTNPDRADPTSEVIVWGPYPQQLQSHKGGDIQFGPDGLLYFSIGDGSNGGTLAGTAQDLMDPRGKILRFDVDTTFPHIPSSNPYVGDPSALDEIYAFGLRNPFRIGIDSLTGTLFVADVGATSWEEINSIPAGPGGQNFGWPCKEGSNSTSFSGCQPNPVPPIYQYDHNEGCAVISGTVYRGSAIPDLYGKYVFCDYCSSRFWMMNPDGTGLVEISTEFQGAWVGGQNSSPTAIRADGTGELYIVNHFSSRVWRVVPDLLPAPTLVCTGGPNSAGPGTTLLYQGTQSVVANDSVFTVMGAPPQKDGVFFYGTNQMASISIGDGILCVKPPIERLLPIVFTDSQGTASRALDITAQSQPSATIQPGTTWIFQYWYRDPAGGTAGFNFSDALQIQYGP